MKKKVGILVLIIYILFAQMMGNIQAMSIHEQYIKKEEQRMLPFYYKGETKKEYQYLTYQETVVYKCDRNYDDTYLNVNGYINLFKGTVKAEEIEKVLKNGYPYKTISELGCKTELEAYYVTQEAIYFVLENKTIENYIAEDEEGVRMLNSLKKIVNKVKEIEISLVEKSKKWIEYEKDTNYKYKEYQIIMPNEVEKANIQIEAYKTSIVNKNNELLQEVSNQEIVKLVVPKNQSQTVSISFLYQRQGVQLYKTINLLDESKYCVLHENGLINKTKKEAIGVEGNTQVTIHNIGSDNQEAIQGNQFEILDEKYNKITHNLITDSNGKIQWKLDKGKYYLKQIKATGEYAIAKELIEISIQEEETIQIEISNAKIKEEEKTITNQEIKVTQEEKNIIENQITNVENIKNTNIQKEIIQQVNETNLNNVNYFINTIKRKNTINLTKENNYRNEIIEKEKIENRVMQGKNEDHCMTRDDYINFIDLIKTSPLDIPNLPIGSRE